MALIFLGKSTCPLCGQILQEGENIIGLPPFCDASHELFEFSDVGYHEQCFKTWNRHEEIEKIIETNKEQFQQTEYFRKMLQLHGPPKPLEDQFVQVINSFKLSDEKIIVFLKWKNGKLASGTLLDNLDGKTWAVRYISTTGSIETYEKTIEEEKNNIFQYLLEPLSEREKPLVNTFLKIQKSD